jgi:hypothetical protein
MMQDVERWIISATSRVIASPAAQCRDPRSLGKFDRYLRLTQVGFQDKV